MSTFRAAAPRAGTHGHGDFERRNSARIVPFAPRRRECEGCRYPLPIATPRAVTCCETCAAWSSLAYHIDGLQAALRRVQS